MTDVRQVPSDVDAILESARKRRDSGGDARTAGTRVASEVSGERVRAAG